MRPVRSADRPFIVAILIMAVVTAVPLVTGRFTFFLDFLVGPAWNKIPIRGFGFRTPAYGGSFPLFLGLTGLARVTNIGLIQKLVLFGIFLLLATSGYLAIPGRRNVRLYAAALLLFNPFVYVRLLAGHWVLLWGLAFLPVVLYTVVNYLETGSKRGLVGVVLALTLLGFNSHLLFAAGILVSFLILSKALETRSVLPVRRGLTAGLLALPLNAYWLGPTVFGSGRSLSGISSFDLVIFAPRIDAATALFSIATMHGFWRGGYVFARDIFAPTQLLFVPILFLAVYGFITQYREPDRGYVTRAVAATAVVAIVLGAGVQGPGASLFRWAFEHVPFFAGMRDSQKFVALLVIAYAYLGALGLGELHERSRTFDLGEFDRPKRGVGPRQLPAITYDRGQLLATGLVVLAILTPIAYTFPMVTGYAGQVSSQDYPSGWYEVDDYLADQPGNDAILFLPWHQYMDYSWLEARNKRLATPARAFFSRPVIQGDNIEIEPTYSTSTNPVSNYVEFLFGLGPQHDRKAMSNMGELLTHIGVKYVLVTKEADWREYDALLRNQSDLTPVLENQDFRVYRNDHDIDRAYATDRITYVADLESFYRHSQRADTTQSLYVIDDERAGEAAKLSGTGREPVSVNRIHPAKYRVAGTDRAFVVFVQRQARYADTWRYGGSGPTARHIGINPIYTASEAPTPMTYGTFYRIYLPSYLISALTLVILVGFVYPEGHRRIEEVRTRLSEFRGGDSR